MSRTYFSPGQLTWEEKYEIRKHALECACRLRSGIQNGYASDQIVSLAKVFEDYLKGEA